MRGRPALADRSAISSLCPNVVIDGSIAGVGSIVLGRLTTARRLLAAIGIGRFAYLTHSEPVVSVVDLGRLVP